MPSRAAHTPQISTLDTPGVVIIVADMNTRTSPARATLVFGFGYFAPFRGGAG